MEIMQQVDDPREGLRIEIVSLVSSAVASHEASQKLSLIPQVCERIPQRRADIGAKTLLIGNRQAIV